MALKTARVRTKVPRGGILHPFGPPFAVEQLPSVLGSPVRTMRAVTSASIPHHHHDMAPGAVISAWGWGGRENPDAGPVGVVFQGTVELFQEEAGAWCLPIISLGHSTTLGPGLGVFWWLPGVDTGL